MLPTRYGSNQPSTSSVRKSRLDNKHSYLPRPRNAGSIDRLSADNQYHSNVRASSADAPRGTFGAGARPNRDSNSKIPLNRRSRSQQQGDSNRFGSMTPLHSTQKGRPTNQPSWAKATTPLRNAQSYRPTMTPNRTPSSDRHGSRNWEASLERVVAFVTARDQRPISDPGWLRVEFPRVRELIAARYDSSTTNLRLMRPLTIAQFIAISGALISDILQDDVKLNNDTYVTKLPILAKLLLYPGTLSKSWLKTVNTLHAFPQALAFIGYLIDLVNRIEQPVSGECIYSENDPLSCLRRELIRECWVRFQTPDSQFDDLYEEYARNLNTLLGNDDEKIMCLTEAIKNYEMCLEDETEQAAIADFNRRANKLASLKSALKVERASRAKTKEEIARLACLKGSILEEISAVDAEIQKASAENERVRKELEEQTMTVEERTRLLDEVDYTNRVIDSKRTLAEQLNKMLLNKENELALWQKTALDACVEYKQGLIHLSRHFPHLAALAVDEKELMSSACQSQVSACVEEVGRALAAHHDVRQAADRARTAARRERLATMEEKRARIIELKAAIHREKAAIESEQTREASSAALWASERHALMLQLDTLQSNIKEHAKVDEALREVQQKDEKAREILAANRANLEKLREEAPARLMRAKQERYNQLEHEVKQWTLVLDQYLNKIRAAKK